MDISRFSYPDEQYLQAVLKLARIRSFVSKSRSAPDGERLAVLRADYAFVEKQLRRTGSESIASDIKEYLRKGARSTVSKRRSRKALPAAAISSL